jgi:hypothetical protein
MKASIYPSGLLEIIPENGTESYALKMWWRNFQAGDQSSLLAVLSLESLPELEEGQIQK